MLAKLKAMYRRRRLEHAERTVAQHYEILAVRYKLTSVQKYQMMLIALQNAGHDYKPGLKVDWRDPVEVAETARRMVAENAALWRDTPRDAGSWDDGYRNVPVVWPAGQPAGQPITTTVRGMAVSKHIVVKNVHVVQRSEGVISRSIPIAAMPLVETRIINTPEASGAAHMTRGTIYDTSRSQRLQDVEARGGAQCGTIRVRPPKGDHSL